MADANRAVAAESCRRPLEVLLIAPPMSIVGGQSVQASRLLSSFHGDARVRFTFLPAGLPDSLQFMLRLPLLRTLVMLACFHSRLLWWIRKADLLHVFTAAGTSFLLTPAPSLLLARVFGKRSVLNYRDGRVEVHLTKWRRSSRLIKAANLVAVNSPYLASVFAKHGIETRVINNMMDPGPFRLRSRPGPRPVFLHNRRLEALYNVPCILRAFSIVQQRYSQASLILAHDGPCRLQLERLSVDLGLRNVTFLGHVRSEEVHGLLDSADIYWMCPNYDSTPGSVLECFAAGLPVIASRAGGIPYIVTHEVTGLLVNCDDADGLAQAAFRLLEEESLSATLTLNARQEVGKYSREFVKGQWLELYAELMGRPELARDSTPA